jgi:hypothetical protein
VRVERAGLRTAPGAERDPYSTSYDPGDEEPFEPGWGSAGWYGAASGTYWTINPKEYADPRKHGPSTSAERGGRERRLDRGRPGYRAGGRPKGRPGCGPVSRGHATALEIRPPEASWTEAGPAPGPVDGRGRPEASAAASTDRILDGPRLAFVVRPAVVRQRFRGPVLRQPSGSVGRLVVAFVGWVGLAAIADTLLGEMTGCSRFSVSCDETAAPASGIVLVALYLPLLALPSVATWLAHGTLAVFLLGFPTAILLSATGGAQQPAASAAVINAVSAIAWVIGIVYAVVMPRLGREPGGRSG